MVATDLTEIQQQELDNYKECNNFEYVNPNPSSLIQSLRAFGYDLKTAIADLIDNSITANASNISIQFAWNNNKPWIAIFDNGTGMTQEILLEAMRLGSTNPLENRDKNDLGRFGLGLKTASFSQCKRMTVITKTCNKDVVMRCWDLDVVSSSNEWQLLKKGSEDADQLSKHYFDEHDNGTIVLWEKLDKIIPEEYTNNESYQDAFLALGATVKKHIAEVFSGYMAGTRKIKFSLNGNPIEMWDPFMLNHDATTCILSEPLYIGNSPVNVVAYILPHQNRLTLKEFNDNAGNKGWTEQQGFYIYRNNRLIIGANWLFDDMQKKEQFKLARIRIDIDNTNDLMWNIDVKKSIAVPPIAIADQLRRIAVFAQKKSTEIFRHRGKKITRGKKKDTSFFWKQILRFGKIGYSINREHPLLQDILKSPYKKEIESIFKLLEETVPVPLIISEYSGNPDKMLTPFEGKELDNLDAKMEKLFNLYIREFNYTPEEAIEILANTEPFLYAPEKVQLFSERKEINHGK